MTTPLRRFVALTATAALALSLSACTAGRWVAEAPPAAGVQADEGGFKLRNFAIVADQQGQAILVGGITSRDEAARVTGIRYAPEKADGGFGQPGQVRFTTQIPKGRTVILNGSTTKFQASGLLPGRLARVGVQFSNDKVVQVEAPIMSSTHPDFASAWRKVYA